MDCADEYSLPIQDFDWLSNSITTRGVLVYNEAPKRIGEVDDDEHDDFAQSDYECVYKRIVELSPSLEYLVTFVKAIIPPQRGEISQLKYQIVDGNAYARKRMIEMHLRIALRIALQRAELYDMDIEDAVSYGCIGLVTAVDKYDPDTSGAFASYATLWILQNISREQSTQRPLIYYPVHKKESYYSMYPLLKSEGCIGCSKLNRCAKAINFVTEKIDCSVKEAEGVLSQMMPDEYIEDLLNQDSINLDESFICDEDVGSILGKSASETLLSDEDMFVTLQYKILREVIDDIFERALTQKEQKVLALRYGLDGTERTLEEVGNIFHVTRERIRQIEAKALRKLRHPSRSKHFRDFW